MRSDERLAPFRAVRPRLALHAAASQTARRREPVRSPDGRPGLPAPAPVDLAHAARLAALAALDADPALRDQYVLKGGLVLHHVYGSPRPSDDLDFNHAEPYANDVNDEHRAVLEAFCAGLTAGLATASRVYGLDRAAVRIEKWSTVLPTVFAWVDASRGGEETSVEMQVTLSEVVCRTVPGRIDGVPVRSAALEDVVADKLKALLQQVPRHQIRQSDGFDLWFALDRAPFVPDPATVASCLRAKAEPWPDLGPLSAARFREHAVRAFAEAGYRKLRADDEVDVDQPPFDVAWARILAFVDEMELAA